MAAGPRDRQRGVLGVAMTAQSVALLASAVTLAVLVGLAVLSWLEHHG